MRPGWTRGAVAAVTTLLVIAAVIAALEYVRVSRPGEALETVLPGADEPEGDEVTPLTCERTTPEATEQQVPEEPPVGRITSAAVVECPDLFDGRRVVYVGEAVGDVLHRQGGAWVLVNDDAYALESGPLPVGRFAGGNTGLSVWLPAPVPERITAGGPERRGDILRILGTIERTDPADGGGLTLRAREVEVLVPSEPLEEPLHTRQLALAGGLVALAVGTVWLERWYESRR